jgi:hypothetical protein
MILNLRNLLDKLKQRDAPVFLLDLLVVASVFSLVCDAVMYRGFLQAHLGFGAWLLPALSLSVLLWAKYRWQLKPHRWLLICSHWGFFVLLLLQIFATYAEHYLFANYLYQLIHVNVYQLIDLVVLSFLLQIVFPPAKSWLRQALIFSAGLIVALIAFLIRIKGYENFVNIFTNDDTFIEWMQVALFSISAVFSGLTAVKLHKFSLSTFLTGVYFLGTLVLVFLVGEEISWGQRLLGIATPQQIREVNLQKEINLHNHQALFGYVYWFYVRFTFYCSVTWLLKLVALQILPQDIKEKVKIYLQFLIPPWYTSSFFVISFILFYFHRVRHIPLNEFEEFNELLIAQGLVIFIIINYLQLRHEHQT